MRLQTALEWSYFGPSNARVLTVAQEKRVLGDAQESVFDWDPPLN